MAKERSGRSALKSLEEDMLSDTDENGMTRADAGHLGGIQTRNKYGKEHYREIGRAGGLARGRK